MTDSDDQSLLEFPCEFPVKAMGVAVDDFDAVVVSIVRNHVTDLNEGSVSTRESRNGKYISVTVVIEAQSQQQINDVYRELSEHDQIIMVL